MPRKILARLGVLLLLTFFPSVSAVRAQAVGPELPPGFYGTLPDEFPGPDAPEGIRRLAFVYTGNIVGEVDPCG